MAKCNKITCFIDFLMHRRLENEIKIDALLEYANGKAMSLYWLFR